ncbi:glycosyltransferase family 2 protein [Marinibaculum pumilum]|uniref:Glycosyltransferase family 2 protein n=1 Tax=Marinibaculum pumilum TaxID=1766165 RepID=A0ABV7L2N0_9PROT
MHLSEKEYLLLRRLLAEAKGADDALMRMLELYNKDNENHSALLNHLCHLFRDHAVANRIVGDFFNNRRMWVQALPPYYRSIAAGLDPRSYFPIFVAPLKGMLEKYGLEQARRDVLAGLNLEGLLTAADLMAYEPERPDPADFRRALTDADATVGDTVRSGRPTYGLLLCNYNDAAHLPRSLSAIAAQTRPFDEIVVVDDGSTDDSLAVIASFADRLPQLRLHRLERNVGVVQAYDMGLNLVTTDFLHLAAADDFIMPGFLEHLAAAGDRWPASGAIFSHFKVQQRVLKVADESWRLNPWADFREIEGYVSPSRIFDLLDKRLIWINGNSALYRTDAFRAATEAKPEHGYLADWLAGIRVMLNYGASFVPRVLSEYSVDGDRFAFRSMNEPARNAATSRSVIRALLAPEGPPTHALTKAFFQVRPNLFEHIPGLVSIVLPTTPVAAGIWLDHLDYYLSRGRDYKPRP